MTSAESNTHDYIIARNTVVFKILKMAEDLLEKNERIYDILFNYFIFKLLWAIYFIFRVIQLLPNII